MKTSFASLAGLLTAAALLAGCNYKPTSDDIQREAQERVLREGTASLGMPAIKNFREKRILKEILELRDQEGLSTYSYTFSAYIGKFVFIGDTIGYPLPAAVQYTNPQKIDWRTNTLNGAGMASGVMAQADPNGLFSPASAEGTWVLMKDPNGKAVKPVYLEERICSFPFKLPDSMVVSQAKP